MHVTDYWRARRLVKEDFPFYAALAYLIQKADPNNLAKLRRCWPAEVDDIHQRYNAPAGALTDDEKELAQRVMDAGNLNSFGEVDEEALKKWI